MWTSRGGYSRVYAPSLMLQVAGQSVGCSLRSVNISFAAESIQAESIHHRAYLSIGVTSSTGAGLRGLSGGGDSRGIGAELCRILDMNFREFLFHALR
jgi:hypothetical protein